jgi:hypothetical protein
MDSKIIIAEESFLKKGRMEKSPLLMDAGELRTWEEQEKAYVRNHLFSIGQPLVYRKDGDMIAEYADGTITQL